MKAARATLLLGVLGALLGACGPRVVVPEPPPGPPTSIEMEPIVVEHHGGPDGDKTDAFDAHTLFESARGAFDAQRFDEAERYYGKLLEYFPDTEYTPSAIYNRGLSLEHLRQYNQAAAHFRRYVQIARTLKDQRDGEFRWGYNLVQTGDYPTAVDLYTRLLVSPDLATADRGEAYLRRGTAYLKLLKFGEAERDLKMSLENTSLAYEGIIDGNELAAEAHFRRGETYQGLSRKVMLKLPVESMKQDLADKVRFFRQAQSSYIDSLNLRNSYWGTAAGLKLGELYEDFYTDVLNAEVPADFDKETRAFYLVELRKRLVPLLEQSLTIYEKNITMSQRIGADNEWTKATEQRLGRLRSLLEAAQRGEEPPPASQPTSAPTTQPATQPTPEPKPFELPAEVVPEGEAVQ